MISSEQVEVDRDGNIWSQLNDGAMRWNPVTETMTIFRRPLAFAS